MPINGNGWEFHVNRLGLHEFGERERTYGTYEVFLNGQSVAGLSGFVCEAIGPGDKISQSGKRILQGRYPLWTQFGRYRTIGYSMDTEVAGKDPMPALLLKETEPRDGILIHPGHPPNLFLSSVGCLNPTKPLSPSEMINFWDSRSRTIALIDNLRSFAPAAFQHEVPIHIPNAWAVIDGEPMNVLSASPQA